MLDPLALAFRLRVTVTGAELLAQTARRRTGRPVGPTAPVAFALLRVAGPSHLCHSLALAASFAQTGAVLLTAAARRTALTPRTPRAPAVSRFTARPEGEINSVIITGPNAVLVDNVMFIITIAVNYTIE